MNFCSRKRKKNEEESNWDKEEDDENVKRVDNCIYFYDEVSRKSILKLAITLKEVTKEIQKNMMDTGGDGKIFLHICSYGGSVYEGLGAMDFIASNPVPITTIIEGIACSAATFIALGGNHVLMRPSAHVLIHQITSTFWGKYEDFNDEKETLDKLMEMLRTMYAKHTDIPKKVLQIMFKRDIYINSDECIKWKVVEKLYE